MPVAIPIAAGLVVAGAGAAIGANAAAKSASDQMDVSRVQLAFQQKARQDQMDISNKDFGEMAAINNQLQASSDILDKHIGTLQTQIDLYNKVGGQANDMLNGKDAASLSPLRNDIERQRQQLTNRLRDQMGSGWASSSAGIEAMSRFNQASNDSVVNAQQSSIGQYLGYGSNINQGINQTYMTAAGIGQGAVGALQTEKGMRIAAANSGSVNYNPSMQAAGGSGAAGAFLGGAMGQVGGALIGASAGIAGGGKK